MTNFEKIKNMSVEEMAELINKKVTEYQKQELLKLGYTETFARKNIINIPDLWKLWLQSKAD